jgi:hypothetical protein
MSKDKEQPEVEEQPQAPEIQATEEAPEKPKPLAGFFIQLEPDGQISRSIYGTQQNVATLYGLIEIMHQEVEAIASGMPGNTPTRDTRLLSNAVTSIGNMANVLIGMQAEIKAIGEQLEEKVDAKSEQKQ